MILCGSSLRPPLVLGPTPFVRLATSAECSGLAIDDVYWLSLFPQLAAEAAEGGLGIVSLVAPQPQEALGRDKRLPALAAYEDPEERLAAVRVTRRSMQVGRDHGARLVELDFGAIPLAADEEALRRQFARRTLDDGEPGVIGLRQALKERQGRSPAIVDACRRSLDRLLPEAERLDTTLALRIASGPFQAPSPREALALVREFAGGPIGLATGPGRLAVLAGWGLAVSGEKETDILRETVLMKASDAVGLDDDLLPGLGEADLGVIGRAGVTTTSGPHPEGGPPAPSARKREAVIVLSGRSDSTEREVSRAREFLRALTAQPGGR